MNDIAHALAQTLLTHHREFCYPSDVPASQMKDDYVQRCTITYGDLCEKSGVPIAPRGIGKYLYEVGVWCSRDHAWPPIHALAVNKETKVPGYNYDDSPGAGGIEDWSTVVRQCIAFKGYPVTVENEP